MVRLDDESLALEVRPPLPYRPDDAQQLTLVSGVADLCGVQFLGSIRDGLQAQPVILLQDAAYTD